MAVSAKYWEPWKEFSLERDPSNTLTCVTKEKELFKMQEEARNDKTEGSYDKIKDDCLVLVSEIQEKVKQSLSR